MIIKALVENTSVSKEYGCIHGLSLYIETEKHKILFDLGPGTLFLENALKMNVSIEDVDTVIISHGHNDHGGALKTFLEKNQKAKIYIRENAFEPYYFSVLGFKVYVGLDKGLEKCDRLVLTKDFYEIDDELQLFSNIIEQKYISTTNKKLYQKVGKKYQNDTFEHEQSLIISQQNEMILVAGCAHKGIVNIMEKAETITGKDINTVLSGFHIFQLSIKNAKHLQFLKELAAILKSKKSKFYTFHCTGMQPYEVLQQEMGQKMNYISTGTMMEL